MSLIAKHLAAKAQEAYVIERGSGAERHTSLIVKRRAAKVREAYVFERGSGVERHTPLIAERRAARAQSSSTALLSGACVAQHITA